MNSFAINIILIILIIFIFILDSMQILMKIKTAQIGQSVLGIHFSSIILLFNRAIVGITLLLIAYLVDIGYKPTYLLINYLIAAILIAITHILIFDRRIINLIYENLFAVIYDRKIHLKKNELVVAKFHVWWALVFISVVGYLGLLIPSVLASLFPDYRAFLMQTGFIINAVAVIFYTYSIEKKIAIATNDKCIKTLMILHRSYHNSRMYSFYLSALLITLIIYII